MAGEAGILIDNGWGQMFLEWPDIVEFSPGNSRSLRIRLREGARPAGSWWVRITSTSARARRTLAVQTFMAVPRPDDVATALSEMQTRHLAGEAGHPAPFTPQ
jgi:hypothetical protein